MPFGRFVTLAPFSCMLYSLSYPSGTKNDQSVVTRGAFERPVKKKS